MSRITVRLNDKELQALVNLAELERRHPREQAAYIIRAALVQCGLIKDETREQPRAPQPNALAA